MNDSSIEEEEGEFSLKSEEEKNSPNKYEKLPLVNQVPDFNP